MMRQFGLFAGLLLLLSSSPTAVLGQSVPFEGGPLQIPFYGQGASPYCWAASIQMVTQSASFSDGRQLFNVIGGSGIDEAGISDWAFRMNNEIETLVRVRCGVDPDRQQWDYINVSSCADYIRRQIAIEGRPVAAYIGHLNHALVFVGYDANTFIIHDPQGVNPAATGYIRRTWNSLTKGLGVRDHIVTLVVPMALDAERPDVTVNIMNNAFRFIQPGSRGQRASQIRFGFDFTRPDGYSWRNSNDQQIVENLPTTVKDLQLEGTIDIVNSHPTEARNVTFNLDVICLDATDRHHNERQTFTLAPNSTKQITGIRIPVDAFRNQNATGPSRYSIIASVFSNSVLVDKATINFAIEAVAIDTPSATDLVNAHIHIEGQGQIDQTFSWNPSGTKVDEPVNVNLDLHTESFPLQITGLVFEGQSTKSANGWTTVETLTGRFSADRRRIEELTATSKAVWVAEFGWPRHEERTWSLTVKNIPLTSGQDVRQRTLEYTMGNLGFVPAGFSITAANYLGTYTENDNPYVGVSHGLRTDRTDHFDFSTARPQITLIFPKSPSLTSPGTPRPPTAASARPRSRRR